MKGVLRLLYVQGIWCMRQEESGGNFRYVASNDYVEGLKNIIMQWRASDLNNYGLLFLEHVCSAPKSK